MAMLLGMLKRQQAPVAQLQNAPVIGPDGPFVLKGQRMKLSDHKAASGFSGELEVDTLNISVGEEFKFFIQNPEVKAGDLVVSSTTDSGAISLDVAAGNGFVSFKLVLHAQLSPGPLVITWAVFQFVVTP